MNGTALIQQTACIYHPPVVVSECRGDSVHFKLMAFGSGLSLAVQVMVLGLVRFRAAHTQPEASLRTVCCQRAKPLLACLLQDNSAEHRYSRFSI